MNPCARACAYFPNYANSRVSYMRGHVYLETFNAISDACLIVYAWVRRMGDVYAWLERAMQVAACEFASITWHLSYFLLREHRSCVLVYSNIVKTVWCLAGKNRSASEKGAGKENNGNRSNELSPTFHWSLRWRRTEWSTRLLRWPTIFL